MGRQLFHAHKRSNHSSCSGDRCWLKRCRIASAHASAKKQAPGKALLLVGSQSRKRNTAKNNAVLAPENCVLAWYGHNPRLLNTCSLHECTTRRRAACSRCAEYDFSSLHPLLLGGCTLWKQVLSGVLRRSCGAIAPSAGPALDRGAYSAAASFSLSARRARALFGHVAGLLAFSIFFVFAPSLDERSPRRY